MEIIMKRLLLIVPQLLFIGLAWGQVDVLWTQTFSSSSDDYGYSVRQTLDGGYILTGYTSFSENGGKDLWLIKTDLNGDAIWTHEIGGSADDGGSSLQQTTDGGYIITGFTYSYGNNGGNTWLIKTNSQGTIEWNQTYGGNENQSGSSVQQTTDGSYIIVGITTSWSQTDTWLIKTDSLGNEEWNQTFGGSDYDDRGFSVQQTEDGGYIITGYTGSYGNGGYDAWLIKTDSEGNEEWNQTFGGSDYDYGHSVQQTEDGGFIITGRTNSYGNGGYDAWLIKTDSEGNEEWNQTFDGSDDGREMQQTTDGGYIIVGESNSDDIYLIKTDSEGVVEIEQKYFSPNRFTIYKNYPNPFNPVTTLQYDLPEDGLVNITIIDMMGKVVNNLVSSQQNAGYKSIQWNATNNQGQPISAGLYLYTIEVGDFRQTKKMVLLK